MLGQHFRVQLKMDYLLQCQYSFSLKYSNFRIIVVQSEPTEEADKEDDKVATLKPNNRTSADFSEQVENSTEQQTTSLTVENVGVNLYILAGHEDMKLQF